MLRRGSVCFAGGWLGQNCETSAPVSAMRSARATLEAGYVRKMPVPITAIVRPPVAMGCLVRRGVDPCRKTRDDGDPLCDEGGCSDGTSRGFDSHRLQF